MRSSGRGAELPRVPTSGLKRLTQRIESPNRLPRGVTRGPDCDTRPAGNRDLEILTRREPGNLALAAIALQRPCATGYCRCSGPKEHKPEDAQDEHRKAGGGCKQGKHRRTRLGLACFGRGFDDPIVLSGCHGDLIP